MEWQCSMLYIMKKYMVGEGNILDGLSMEWYMTNMDIGLDF